jgi:polar amino acid transport system substrate-binding protein
MRKTAVVLALAAAAVVGAGTAGGAQQATFTFCTDPTFPPLEFATSSGAIRGFDVDMASALAKTWGATAKPLKTAFPSLIPALKAKKCDAVISGIFVTPDRVKQAGAVPYMETHRVLIVKAGNPKHVTGPAGLKALKSKIDFNLQSYPGDNDAVAQVILGRADVVLTQDTSFAFQAKAHPGKIAVAYVFPQKDTFGIYFRKGESIGAQIRTGVSKLRANGTLRRIAATYKIPIADVK